MRLRPLKNTNYVQAKALLQSKEDQDYLAAIWYWREPTSVCVKWYGQVVGFCLIAGDVTLVGHLPDWDQMFIKRLPKIERNEITDA